ncbi:MAG TPA: hypothetical protein VGI99_00385 [Gemmataceae bacterium]|jgi:hypothetical protein
MATRLEYRCTFVAEDGSGAKYTVNVYDFIEKSLDGSECVIGEEMKTDDGRKVIQLAKGQFQIDVPSRTLLASDDCNCP